MSNVTVTKSFSNNENNGNDDTDESQNNINIGYGIDETNQLITSEIPNENDDIHKDDIRIESEVFNNEGTPKVNDATHNEEIPIENDATHNDEITIESDVIQNEGIPKVNDDFHYVEIPHENEATQNGEYIYHDVVLYAGINLILPSKSYAINIKVVCMLVPMNQEIYTKELSLL